MRPMRSFFPGLMEVFLILLTGIPFMARKKYIGTRPRKGLDSVSRLILQGLDHIQISNGEAISSMPSAITGESIKIVLVPKDLLISTPI